MGGCVKLIAAIRGYRRYGAYILFIVLPLRGDCLTLRAVFDALFPSTPFKSLLVHAMQLHGMLDSISKQSDISDKKHLQEIMSLSLAALERSVDALGNERIKCRTQDLEYLLVVLDKVALRACEVLSAVQADGHIFCVQRVLALQEKIDRML